MMLAAIAVGNAEEAAVLSGGGGFVPIRSLNNVFGTKWRTDVLGLLEREETAELNAWLRSVDERELSELALPAAAVRIRPLYARPGKIWGVGANYAEKAAAMAVTPPDREPICFPKPDTSLIGDGDAILLPRQSEKVTAEAELGIVIGTTCKGVDASEAAACIAGFVPTLDMTAQDIHARNPRFLSRSKSFDTFFSFGPCLATPDEIPNLGELTVETVRNGKVEHRDRVSNMMYDPAFLVSFFSGFMTLRPGDVIMTGTPGSVEIRDGDEVECRIGGFMPLRNRVKLERAIDKEGV